MASANNCGAGETGPIDYPAAPNKLGITSQAQLDKVEADVYATRYEELIKNPIKGNFDLKHLKDINKKYFGEVYEWAGKLRTENIKKLSYDEKGNRVLSESFADKNSLEVNAKRLFNRVLAENLYKGTSDKVFDEKIGKLYGAINTLHVFPEGNGRTQIEYLRELGLQSGRKLDFTAVDKEQIYKASIASHERNDQSGLIDIIRAAREKGRRPGRTQAEANSEKYAVAVLKLSPQANRSAASIRAS